MKPGRIVNPSPSHRPSSLRFHPPAVQVSAELRWLLLRAFGPAAAPFDEPLVPGTALTLARRFDLAARVATRIPPDVLDREIGASAREFLQARRDTAERVLRALRVAASVADVAARAGIPLLFLKGVALHLSGRAMVSARGVGDVDVMVRREDAERLGHLLIADGFRRAGKPGSPHHARPMVPRQGPPVEIHWSLPGLRIEGSDTWITMEQLQRNGLLAPCPGLPGGAFVPGPAVLAIHAAVHGIAQHGFRPAGYPGLRFLGDVIDCTASGENPSAVLRQAARQVHPALHADELAAACEAATRLFAGDPLPWTDPAADRLVRHFVAGVLDADYRDALDLIGLVHPMVERSVVGATARRVAQALFYGMDDAEPASGELAMPPAPAKALRLGARRLLRSAAGLLRLRLRRGA